MAWKLTTLIENHADAKGCYQCEHGFSILIEKNTDSNTFKMLMDTGQSGAFYENALKMGEKLDDLDCICISHGHYDHAGGLLRLLEETGKQKKLYVGKGFFQKKYFNNQEGGCRDIGIPFEQEQLMKYSMPVMEVEKDEIELAPGIWLHRNFDRTVPYEMWDPGFRLKKDGIDVLDTFEDESALALETETGLCVIAGCSHPGVVNILKTIAKRTGKPIRGVVGGTHLRDANEDRLEKTMEDFKKLGMEFIGVSHCTGSRNIEILRDYFGPNFIFNCTGTIINI